MADTRKRREGDLDRAARLLAMESWGVPLDVEDQLWLASWKALMDEVEHIEYRPTVMFRSSRQGTSRKEG